jgi:hypothetical protein
MFQHFSRQAPKVDLSQDVLIRNMLACVSFDVQLGSQELVMDLPVKEVVSLTVILDTATVIQIIQVQTVEAVQLLHLGFELI